MKQYTSCKFLTRLSGLKVAHMTAHSITGLLITVMDHADGGGGGIDSTDDSHVAKQK